MSPSLETRQLVVACVAFFATGMTFASIGPAIPDLTRVTGAGTMEIGGVLVAMQAGGLAGQIAAAVLERAFGRKFALRAGMSAFLAGSLGVAASSNLTALLAAAFCQGSGSGIFILLGNVLAAEASRGAGPLNLVNAMFGLGAILSPALVAASIAFSGSGLPALWAVPCVLLAGLLLLVFWLPDIAASPRPPAEGARGSRRRLPEGVWSPLLWTLCALVLVYVGTESSIAGWLSTLVRQTMATTAAVGALATSWFYVAHTSARFGAAWASRFVSADAMLRTCVWTCLAGSLLFAAGAALGSRLMGGAAAAVLGVSIGPILPSALAIVRSSTRLDLSLSTAIVMGVSAIGGIGAPWTLGAVIATFGGFAGALMLVALAAGMAVLFLAIEAQRRGAPSSAAMSSS